jgi:hypothetical protein
MSLTLSVTNKAIMLSDMLRGIVLSVIMLSDIMLRVFMLIVLMPSVFMLNAVMQSVTAPMVIPVKRHT